MTREEAVAVLKAFMENPLFSDVHKAAFNIAIHDIKQRHDWDINNLILINKDNYEPLKQEPKTGKWISTETKGVRYAFWCRYKCSLCGGLSDCTNFCPNCGARMVEPQESKENKNIN